MDDLALKELALSVAQTTAATLERAYAQRIAQLEAHVNDLESAIVMLDAMVKTRSSDIAAKLDELRVMMGDESWEPRPKPRMLS